MDTLYRNSPQPVYPTLEDEPEDTIGQTADGTPVVTIAGPIDAYYAYRKWGYDAGLWQHTLCQNPETSTQMIVSYHSASQTEKIQTRLTALAWTRQVPACMAHLY